MRNIFTRDARTAGRVKVWVGYLFFFFYTGCPQGRPCLGLGRLSVFFFYTGCPQGRPCLGLGRLSFFFFLHGMPAGQAVSRFGSAIFLHGMPAGQAVSRFGSAIFFFFFFFVVATNLNINLFIKLSPLLEEMYCSHCVQQKRPNENLLLARISRGRGPPSPYLCDVKSSFDLFIKPRLNSLLVAAILFTSFRLNYAVSKKNLTLLKRQMERSTSQKHSTGKTVEIGEFLAKESCFV